MDSQFYSLVIFTLLVQTSAGLFLFAVFHAWLSQSGSGQGRYDKRILLTAFILLLCSLAASFMHLGSPSEAVNALRGSQTSWLSKEILAIILTTVFMGLNTILTYTGTRREFTTRLDMLSAIFYIALLFSMSKVYMIPSRPAWNSWTTPAAFLSTTFVAGAILMYLQDVREQKPIFKQKVIFPVFAVIISLMTGFIGSGSPAGNSMTLLLLRLLFSICAVVFLILSTFSSHGQNKRVALLVLVIVSAMLSEVAGRVHFFILYDLPGQ